MKYWKRDILEGCFSRSPPSSTPIFEAELCAALAGIYYHLPYSNFIRLVGDNLGVLFVLNKGSCRNSSANFYLQNLGKVYLQSPFLLDLCYICSENNPADCFTRRVFPFFSFLACLKFSLVFFLVHFLGLIYPHFSCLFWLKFLVHPYF